jgi:hypothetical protein
LALRCELRSHPIRDRRSANTAGQGAGGTVFYVDPRDDMFVVCMMQTLTQGAPIQAALKTLIYEALEN